MMEDNRFQFLMPQDNYELQQKAYAVRPQSELGERLKGKKCDWYQDWLSAVSEDSPYWSNGFWKELQEAAGNVSIPMYLHGGWFDIFLRSQIDSYRALPKEVRGKSRFLIGPWNHGGIPGGTLQYPGENCTGMFQLKAALEWFDYHLKGMDYEHSLGVIEAYSVGDNQWKRWKDDFHADTEMTFYMDKKSDTILSTERPETEQYIGYLYNPKNPVESVGGTLLSNNRNPLEQPECSTEQPPVGERSDVISFVSDVFTKDTCITGAMDVYLYVKSSAPATAFTVKVIEIFGDGRSMNIRDDITDIRWADEVQVQEYTPGTVRELKMTLLDISWRLLWRAVSFQNHLTS